MTREFGSAWRLFLLSAAVMLACPMSEAYAWGGAPGHGCHGSDAGHGSPGHAGGNQSGRGVGGQHAGGFSGSGGWSQHAGNFNGNGNVGAFNGNFNGNGNVGRFVGNWNGNGNVGFGNGNLNGNRNRGFRTGNLNGNDNRGALNGNWNGNFEGRRSRGMSQHVSVSVGTVSLREGYRALPNGNLVGRFSFRDGPVAARGVFSEVAGSWTFSFSIRGVPGVDRVVTTDGRISQANFVGCIDCGGVGNVGAFEGLGNASPTSGNYNSGVFNGNFNGGAFNGNGNVGAFNGNFNGLGFAPDGTNGSYNGNGNRGFFNGNFNGGSSSREAVERTMATSIMRSVGQGIESGRERHLYLSP